MGSLGTRKFYKTFDGASDVGNNQILKNSGYISIVLHSVFYNSKGNFWQRMFGGSDKIALTSSISYLSTARTIEAIAIQDKRKVKSDITHILGLARLVALKIPANADGLELKVVMTAIKDDSFENGIDLMNNKEFQEPFQLSSLPIGQILAVTKVIKKIFAGIEESIELDATFAGIISKSKVSDPIERERLTDGYLIMIANNEEDNDYLENLDPEKLQVEADGLKYNGERVEHTNIIYSITFETLKGVDENSKWFDKYQLALSKLDDIIFQDTEEGKKRVLVESRKLWIEGSALLFDDPSYTSKEQASIKGTYFKKINEQYQSLTSGSSEEFLNQFLAKTVVNLDFIPSIKQYDVGTIELQTNKLTTEYLKELSASRLVFPE
ncbi:MAG: hypothetical protein K8S62_12080 [Candidatus Sabulitectum sp.]|nr:hypothetical protein [Candidatus Sabulitectum sp.]